MKKVFYIIVVAVRYTLTAGALLLLLGEPNDNTTLKEFIAYKVVAVAWFVYLYIRDGRKSESEQVFYHPK